MYPEVATSADMQELQKLLRQKPYLKNLEIKKYYDYIDDVHKIDLLLTTTAECVSSEFPEQDDLKICFENIYELEIGEISSIVCLEFIIYDYAINGYENQSRFQLVEEENSALNFFFEKAKISS